LIIFFSLYNAAISPDTGKSLVRVTVKMMKDNKQAMKPVDYVLTEGAALPVPNLMFAKYISLAGLSAGNYVAVIESLDVVTHKVLSQQAPFVVIR
jgi:hypothetical protein